MAPTSLPTSVPTVGPPPTDLTGTLIVFGVFAMIIGVIAFAGEIDARFIRKNDTYLVINL